MAFWYSVRVSRRSVAVRPGFGLAAAARSSDVSSDATVGVVGRLVRPILADRRHLPGAQLPDDLLPDVRMADVLGVDRLQHEAALLVILVVAGETVLVDQRDLWPGQRGMRRRGMSCRVIRSGQVRRPNRWTADEQDRRNPAHDGTPVNLPRRHTPQ